MRDLISGAFSRRWHPAGLLKQQRDGCRTDDAESRRRVGARLAGRWLPLQEPMLRRNYERAEYRLQVELLSSRPGVKETGQKVVIPSRARRQASQGDHNQGFMKPNLLGSPRGGS